MKNLRETIKEILTESANGEDFRHFVRIVKNYNHHAWREHGYATGQTGHPKNWNPHSEYTKKRIKEHEIGMELSNHEFKLRFGHLIPKKDKKDFNLGHYDTEDEEKMAHAWLHPHTHE